MTSEATPKKCSKRDTDDDGEHNLEGSEYTDPHRCIQLQSNESFHITIRQRRYFGFTTIEDNKSIYVLPLDWLQFYTSTLHVKGNPAKTLRWNAIDTQAHTFGCKVHKAGVTLHSMIPIQKDLKIQGGTAIETLTFTDTPYLEIFKDTNHSKTTLTTTKNIGLKEWLYNPQPLEYTKDGAEYEEPISSLGTMEQMHAGDRKTYTIHPNNDRWYAFSTNDNTPTYLPRRVVFTYN